MALTPPSSRPSLLSGRPFAPLPAATPHPSKRLSAPCLVYGIAVYTQGMRLDFDPDKDAANLEKHGVSLAFGGEVLGDSGRLDIVDVRFDYAEERYITYGWVAGRVWVCVYHPAR